MHWSLKSGSGLLIGCWDVTMISDQWQETRALSFLMECGLWSLDSVIRTWIHGIHGIQWIHGIQQHWEMEESRARLKTCPMNQFTIYFHCSLITATRNGFYTMCEVTRQNWIVSLLSNTHTRFNKNLSKQIQFGITCKRSHLRRHQNKWAHRTFDNISEHL